MDPSIQHQISENGLLEEELDCIAYSPKNNCDKSNPESEDYNVRTEALRNKVREQEEATAYNTKLQEEIEIIENIKVKAEKEKEIERIRILDEELDCIAISSVNQQIPSNTPADIKSRAEARRQRILGGGVDRIILAKGEKVIIIKYIFQ